MAVTNQTPRNVSTATAGATVFPYSFKVISAGDLHVEVDGVAKTLDVDYTVSGVGNDAGGDVTFLAAMAGGEVVARKRNMAYERQADYQNLGDLRSSTLNNDQDAPVLMIQQLAESVGRALRVPVASGGSVNAELPPPVAGKVLAWNSTGTGVINGDPTSDLLLRGDLASSATGKGANLIADTAHAGAGPPYLQTLSAIRNGEEVAAIKAIPAVQHAEIYAGTSTYDASVDLNDLIADMLTRGGQLLLPRGKIMSSGLLLDYTGIADDLGNTRFTIRGQGAKTTELGMLASAGNVLSLAGVYPNSTIKLADFRIRGNGGTTRALRASQIAGLNLDNVVCQGAEFGWLFEDVLALNAINASAVFNTYGARMVKVAHTFPNLLNLNGGSIGGNTMWGLEVTGGCNLNARGVGIEGNGVGQALASASCWGVKLINAGTEGGAAASLDGCYFENNNGQSDLWVIQSSLPVSVHASGNSFGRISSTNYVTNNVRLETSGTGKIDASLPGNGYFVAGTYVRDAARRTVLGVGVAGSISFAYDGSMGANDVDRPALNQSGRINDPDCTPQGWVRGDGASSTVTSSRRLATYARNGVGDFTVMFDHDIPAAKCYQITLESTVPLCWQLVSETANSVNFTVKNAAGSLTDPTRVFVSVFG